jgi:hypothetical protein
VNVVDLTVWMVKIADGTEAQALQLIVDVRQQRFDGIRAQRHARTYSGL